MDGFIERVESGGTFTAFEIDQARGKVRDVRYLGGPRVEMAENRLALMLLCNRLVEAQRQATRGNAYPGPLVAQLGSAKP